MPGQLTEFIPHWPTRSAGNSFDHQSLPKMPFLAIFGFLEQTQPPKTLETLLGAQRSAGEFFF